MSALTTNMAGGGGGADDNTAQGGHLIAATLRTREGHGCERGDGQDNLVAFAWQAGGNNSASGAFNDDGTTPTLPKSQTLAVAYDLRNGSATDQAMTLQSGGMGDGRGRSINSIPHVGADTVRRLTPLECERLQGFPDGWTDGQADAPRYRQMGNAVAVPVVEWIMRRLAAVAA